MNKTKKKMFLRKLRLFECRCPSKCTSEKKSFKVNKMAKPDRYISNSKHDRNYQLEPNLSLLEPFVWHLRQISSFLNHSFKLYMTFSDKHFRLTPALCFALAFLVALLPRSSRFTLKFLVASLLWLPLSFVCFTSTFGCLQTLLVIQQPLAAFKLCLL